MPRLREQVAAGETDGPFAINLDPGTYRVKVIGPATMGQYPEVMWMEELVVGNDEVIKRFRHAQPKWARAIQTSQGARWRCTMMDCGQESTSAVGAYIHEMKDHFNMDPEKATAEEVAMARQKAPQSASAR